MVRDFLLGVGIGVITVVIVVALLTFFDLWWRK